MEVDQEGSPSGHNVSKRVGSLQRKNVFPERPGEANCLYYMRTGDCKFGAVCRFHHPRERLIPLSPLGLPLRPGEPLCIFYSHYGFCKFGSSCKFDHPVGLPLRPRENVFPERPGQPECQFYMRTGDCRFGATCWFHHPRERLIPTPGFSPFGLPLRPRENIFLERPGQPECQLYMRTGDCKFGAVCRYHHPRKKLIPAPDSGLSPLGLPLRPGEPVCSFYSLNGLCKFGSSCKFDHPMMTLMSNLEQSKGKAPLSSHESEKGFLSDRVLRIPNRQVESKEAAAVAEEEEEEEPPSFLKQNALKSQPYSFFSKMGPSTVLNKSFKGRPAEEMTRRAEVLRRKKDFMHLVISYRMKPEPDAYADLIFQTSLFSTMSQLKRELQALLSDNSYGKEGNELGEVVEKIENSLQAAERILAKYDFHMVAYLPQADDVLSVGSLSRRIEMGLTRQTNGAFEAPDEMLTVAINSATRQVSECIDDGIFRKIGISGIGGDEVARAVLDIPKIRAKCSAILHISVSGHHSTKELRQNIAK